MAPLIVGISGKLGSGKNTVGDLVESGLIKADVAPQCFAFGDTIKQVATALTGNQAFLMDTSRGRYLHADGDRSYKDLPSGIGALTNGQLLVAIGDGLRATCGADVFVHSLALRVEDESPDVAILTDVRFPNELAWVRAQGGLTVRVEGDPVGERARSSRDPNHPSETALDTAEFDIVVDNSHPILDALETPVGVIVGKVVGLLDPSPHSE